MKKKADEETASSARGGNSQAAIACKAMRLGITSVAPSSRIKSFRFISLNKRVTVSRDDPIIWAISS